MLRTSLKVLLLNILGKPLHFQIGSSGKLATFFFYLFIFYKKMKIHVDVLLCRFSEQQNK